MTNITFDTNDLQTDNIITSDIDHGSIPEKSMSLFALASANKSVIPAINYPTKTITVTGKIIGSSVTDLDSRLDTFRSYFNGKNKNLDIDYDGGTRRYIATASKVSIPRPGGLTFANFVITFVCVEPFGKATTSTSALSANARTSADYTDAYTFLGTAPFQLPVVTITINTVTGGTGHLAFTNDSNDQGITLIDKDFQNGDVIVIDCEQRSVTINGTATDYLGSFPEFPPGSQTMHYNDGFTARNFDIDVDYYKRYL